MDLIILGFDGRIFFLYFKFSPKSYHYLPIKHPFLSSDKKNYSTNIFYLG